MREPRFKLWLIVITLAACVVVLSADATSQRPSHSRAVKAPLIELHSIDQLKEAFRRDDGKVRMVVLVSPT